jgi:hypothetical protein
MFKKICSFENYTLVQEARLFIWAKPFRIDDLFNSKLFKETDVFNWMRKYKFDRYAIGVLVSKEKIKDKKATIKRYDDRSPVKSEFGNLLDTGDIDSIEAYKSKSSESDISDKISSLELRLSKKGVKGEHYFDDEKKVGKGDIIEESKFNYNDSEIYLYIFDKGKNNDKRARQLNGIIYEADIKREIGLKHSPKGERWDAVGALDKLYLAKMDSKGYNLFFNSEEMNDYSVIPVSFFDENNNWSVKSCSNKGSTIYFGDFKRISGLVVTKNGKIKLVDKNLKNFMLVVGLHTNGIFTKKYIVNVNLDYWLTLIPDVSDPKIIKELELMYLKLEEHRLGKPSSPGVRTDETESMWKEFTNRFKKLTKDKKIKLNFKRDTKGQLRIQCSMSRKFFETEFIKNSDYILIAK